MQANGMVEKGKEKLTSQTELSIRDNGMVIIGIKRHGFGTLHSEEGQVLNQGKWDKGEYVGKE